MLPNGVTGHTYTNGDFWNPLSNTGNWNPPDGVYIGDFPPNYQAPRSSKVVGSAPYTDWLSSSTANFGFSIEIDHADHLHPASALPAKVERCEHCGVKAEPHEKFCEGCGAPL
jgi:hypothetical protein